jgi:FAD/FMN-containing dehydrogenase
MGEHVLHPAAVRDLKAHLHGELIEPSDRGYHTARKVWNVRIDKYPTLIVRCIDQADMVSTVQFARRHQLLVAVRGGGHSLNGSSVCDGGIVIDLSRMKGICIDSRQRTAWAQASLTLVLFAMGTMGYFYLAGAVILGGGLVYLALRL